MDNFKRRGRWVTEIEEAFADLNLRGLKVKCPVCKELGQIVTKWIKGKSVKPLYVVHIKRGKVEKVCEPNEEAYGQLRCKAAILQCDLKRLLKLRRPFVLFSGGKDSLATLSYLGNLSSKAGTQLTAIYVDTTAGLPENTKYVKNACNYLGVKLVKVSPKTDYFSLVEKWGIPSFRYRWCCRELKIRPIRDYLENIKEPKVVFDGIRAEESSIRRTYIPIWYHPGFKCLSVSPIFSWSKEQVIEYISRNGLPKTLLHSLPASAECWCGAYKTQADFARLYDLDRNMFRKLARLEEGNRNGYTFLYKDGQRIPLKLLEKKILENCGRSDR